MLYEYANAKCPHAIVKSDLPSIYHRSLQLLVLNLALQLLRLRNLAHRLVEVVLVDGVPVVANCKQSAELLVSTSHHNDNRV